MVFSQNTEPVNVSTDDYIEADLRLKLAANGIQEDHFLEKQTPTIPDIYNCFPVIEESSVTGACLKYAPIAINAPDGTFEEMTNMEFDGLSPYELYTRKVRPKIADNSVFCGSNSCHLGKGS